MRTSTSRPLSLLPVALAAAVLATAAGFAQPTATPRGISAPPANPDACAGGVVKDDGTVETGYGWVPSVVEGQYVQELQRSDLAFGEVSTVCVCWLRNDFSDGPDIAFDVVFYADVEDMPALEPFAVVPATASVPVTGIDNGVFFEVDVGAVSVPPGPFYVGVRWNPSVDRFFFLCADHTLDSPVTDVWFIDDRAEEWASALTTTDPIFTDHRAVFVRAVGAEPQAVAVPALPVDGLVLLALFLGASGLGWLARRR